MKNQQTDFNKTKNKIWYALDVLLLIIILITVIYGQIDGRYIRNTNTIIEVCNGQDGIGRQILPPTLEENYPFDYKLNITLEDIKQ